MFGKLKDKLKRSLSAFSKKAEEEAVEKEVEVPAEEIKEPVEDEKKEKPAVKESKESKERDEKKVEVKVTENISEEKPETEHLSKKEVEKEVNEQKLEKLDQQIEGFDKKEETVKKPSATELLDEVGQEEDSKEDFSAHAKKEVEEPTTETVPKKGLFGKIKKKFTTKVISKEKFVELFWELEIALLENNVSMEVIEKIKEDLQEELVDKPLPRDVTGKIMETLKQTFDEVLSVEQVDLLKKAEKDKPLVIAFFGVNGSGKTTSIAKLTNYFKEHGKSVVLAACDTFRAAAIQQLEEHANKLDVKMIKHDYGSDAAAVAFDAVKYAKKNGDDVVMIDTAGRLHSNTNLMQELEKIIRITKPHLKIFVGESITGNDCIEQAKKFNELVEMDGAILTKADVDDKGGAPLSVAYTIKKPILFLGMGQEYKDLEVFDKDKILARLGL